MRRDTFRGGLRDVSEGGWLMDNLVLCEDMRLGRQDRFYCGIEGLSSEGGLHNIDRVIVESDMFGGGSVSQRYYLERILFDLDVGKKLYIRYSAAIHGHIQLSLH